MTQKQKRIRKSKWRTAAEANRTKDLDFEKPETLRASRRATALLSVVTGLILIGFLAVFLVILNSNQSGAPKSPPPTPVSPPKITWEGPLPRTVLKKFKDATKFEERLSCLMFPLVVRERARTFFSEGPGKDEKIRKFSQAQLRVPGKSDKPANYRFNSIMENAAPRIVLLTIDPEGPRIDFDLYARYCSVPWGDLLSGKVNEASEMRVVLKKDHYYFGEYSNENRWYSAQGDSPDLAQPINLYLERSHPGFKEISKILEDRRLRINVALKSTPESREQGQFEITEVNALHWMTLETPPGGSTPPK